MATIKPYEPISGKVSLDGKIRTIIVNVPKTSFCKKEGESAEEYTAEDILADSELVAALVKSKSSAIKVIFSASDAIDTSAKTPVDPTLLAKDNALLKADNSTLQETNARLTTENNLHVEDKKTLVADIDQHVKDKEALNAQIQKLTDDNTALQAQIDGAKKATK